MNNIPSLPSNSATMSSLEIAKLTGKEHSKVIADIQRILFEAEIGDAEFRASYITEQNKELPCYNLPRRECDLVISGYTVKYRLLIIDRWHELEAKQEHQIPKTFSAALRLAGELQEKVELLQLEAKENAPKVEFALAVRRMEGACKIGEFGKAIGIGQNKLFARLREDEILMENNLPYQKYIDQELFVVIEQTPYTDRAGKSHPTFTTMVTGKGQVYLEKKYRIN